MKLAIFTLAVAVFTAAPASAQSTDTDTEPALTDEELIEAMEAEAEAEGDGEESYDTLGFDDLDASLEGAESRPPELPLFGETTFSLTNTTLTELRSNDFEDDQYLGSDAIAWTLIERLELVMQGEKNLRLAAQIQSLRTDPRAIERLAREELGLARPGETVFLIRDEAAADRP